MPDSRALKRERALPSAERGPVEFWAFEAVGLDLLFGCHDGCLSWNQGWGAIKKPLGGGREADGEREHSLYSRCSTRWLARRRLGRGRCFRINAKKILKSGTEENRDAARTGLHGQTRGHRAPSRLREPKARRVRSGICGVWRAVNRAAAESSVLSGKRSRGRLAQAGPLHQRKRPIRPSEGEEKAG